MASEGVVRIDQKRPSAHTGPMDPWTLAFLVAGLAHIASEFIVPSLMTVFLGVAALMTAGLRGIGLIESIPSSFLLWSVISLGLVLPFRPLVQKLMPGGKSVVKRDTTDVENDRDFMGEIVEIVEDVAEDHERGRIRFQGTTWQARATMGAFKAGEKAQLVYREGSVWILEPVSVLDDGARELFAVDPVPAAVVVEKKQG